MKDAMGGTWLTGLVILFLALFACFLAYSISYTKAFRTKNEIINIYYHDEEAQERLINNITDIIGEEEVMMRVRLIYQHDENRGILKHRD